MNSTARSLSSDSKDSDKQGVLDIEAHAHNLAIEFVENNRALLDSKANLLTAIKAMPEFKGLTDEELEPLIIATIAKSKHLINLEKKQDLLKNVKEEYTKFEKERFVRAISTEIPEAANDNASIAHKIKKVLGLAVDLKTKQTPDAPASATATERFSTLAANDVDQIKENDGVKDDLYILARTIARLEGEMKELADSKMLSSKFAEKVGKDFDLIKSDLKKIGGVVSDYGKILSLTEEMSTGSDVKIAVLARSIDTKVYNAWYKPPTDAKYSEAYVMQAKVESKLMEFEKSLRKELGMDMNDEDAELDDVIPTGGIELLDFQKRQTRINELMAGIDQLMKNQQKRSSKSIDAQKIMKERHIEAVKKDKTETEKRVDKWEDGRAEQMLRLFWFEFGNQVIAVKQRKANLTRIGTKGRAIYESHLNTIMNDYQKLRADVIAYEEAAGMKGFMECLDSEFGQIKMKNSVVALREVKAEIERAKQKMTPRTNHKAPPAPDVNPPQFDEDIPDSGTRRKAGASDVNAQAVGQPLDGSSLNVDDIGNDNRLNINGEKGNDNTAEAFEFPERTLAELEVLKNSELSQDNYKAHAESLLGSIEEPVQARLQEIATPTTDEEKHEKDLGLTIMHRCTEIRNAINASIPVTAEAVLNAIELYMQLDIGYMQTKSKNFEGTPPHKLSDVLVMYPRLAVPATSTDFPKVVCTLEFGGVKYLVKLAANGLVLLYGIDATGNEYKVLNSLEIKAEADEAARLNKERADRMAEAAELAEKARKAAETKADKDTPDEVIDETKSKVDKGLETKEVLLPSELLIVADLHGNYQAFEDTMTQVLKAAVKQTDGNLKWVGGNRKLNSLGDILWDRVPQSFKIFKQIGMLRKQAEAENGKLRVIAGNHEDFGIGFFMGGEDTLNNFRHATRNDSAGNLQGRGLQEFFRYTEMGKKLSENDLFTKLVELKEMSPSTVSPQLEQFRAEILENMRNDAEGREILEEMCNMNLVLEDDGVAISIHTEPTGAILLAITDGATNKASILENIKKLNVRFQTLLKKMLLSKDGLDGFETQELKKLRETFLYTDNRGFKTAYESAGTGKKSLKVLADAGYKNIFHGHTDLHLAPNFVTAEGIVIRNLDRSAGKTEGTSVVDESSTAVMFRDEKIITGQPIYTDLKEFDYTARTAELWMEEVFGSADQETTQKLVEQIGEQSPEKLSAMLNNEGVRNLLQAAYAKYPTLNKDPESIKTLVNLYYEWMVDVVKDGKSLDILIGEMMALNASIDNLAAEWRAKVARDQHKEGDASSSVEPVQNEGDKKKEISESIKLTDETQVSFVATQIDKSLFEQDKANEMAMEIFKDIFKYPSDQMDQINNWVKGKSKSDQIIMATNLICYQDTIRALINGKFSGLTVFGTNKLPRKPVLFKAVGGLDTTVLDILINTKKLQTATKALASLNGRTIGELKKFFRNFRNKNVRDWVNSLK